MLDLVSSLVAVCEIVLAAFGLGRPLFRKLAGHDDDPLATIVWSLSLGLIAMGAILSAAAIAGCLYRPAILAVTFCAAFWGLGEFCCLRLASRVGVVLDLKACPPLSKAVGLLVPRWMLRLLVVSASLSAAAALISALAPPTSPEALAHHLELAKTFLLSGGVVELPYNDRASGPMTVEMWYLWALALDGPVAAGLMQWCFGMLLSLAACLLARPLVGRTAATVCGALVLLAPGVSYQMQAPLDDLAAALFTTLTLAAAWRAIRTSEDGRWYLIAGMTAGAAIGVKSIGLAFSLSVLAVSALAIWRQPIARRHNARGLATAAGIALTLGGVWYLRAAWLGGAVAPYETCQDATQQLGALLIAAVPAIFLVRNVVRFGLFMRVALLYTLLAAIFVGHLRWWAPLVPILALAATLVWTQMAAGRTLANRLAQCGLLALVVAAAAAPIVRSREHLAVAFGWQSRDDYLLRHESSYPAALLANQLIRPGDHVLSQDPQAFYFCCPTTDERALERRVGYAMAPGESLSRRLRSAGFTHVLLASPGPRSPVESNSNLGELIQRELEEAGEGSPLPLADHDWSDSSTARRYRLVLLR